MHTHVHTYSHNTYKHIMHPYTLTHMHLYKPTLAHVNTHSPTHTQMKGLILTLMDIHKYSHTLVL